MSHQRIAFVGTGANGAGIAADLTRAGLDVTFIEQWPAHVEAMRAHGITVRMRDREEVTPVTAYHLCEVATLREKFDIVFTLVKAYDTRWAVELIKPLVADDGLVVGLQNGMSLDDIADIVGPERTIGAVIEVGSNMWEPGIVNRDTPPENSWFGVGAYDDAARGREVEVQEVLRHAGAVDVYDDIRSAKWMKLIANAGELVPSAILDLPLSDAIREPGMYDFMLEACAEAAEVALASGNQLVPIFGLTDVDLSDPRGYSKVLIDKVLTSFNPDGLKVTVLQDWIKGRRGEVAEINGLVCELGALHGVATPANAITVEIARRIESGELDRGTANAALLLPALAR